MNTTLIPNRAELASKPQQKEPTVASTGPYQAWVAKAPNQPIVLEDVDLGQLGAEDVDVAVALADERDLPPVGRPARLRCSLGQFPLATPVGVHDVHGETP